MALGTEYSEWHLEKAKEDVRILGPVPPEIWVTQSPPQTSGSSIVMTCHHSKSALIASTILSNPKDWLEFRDQGTTINQNKYATYQELVSRTCIASANGAGIIMGVTSS